MSDEIILFRCTECGKLSVSLGWLHAHIERHRGYTSLGIQLPFTKTSPGNAQELMKRTDILRVEDYDVVGLDEVEVTS